MEPSQPTPHRTRFSVRSVSPVKILVTLAGALLVVGGTGAAIAVVRHQADEPPAPAAPAPIGSDGAPTSADCRYVPADDDSTRPGAAPHPQPTILGRPHVTVYTDQGRIGIDLAADAAPCTVNSFLTLARAGFFTGIQCHRLTTEGIYVLQCGDPTGTGAGGPGYRFDDENLPVGQQPAYPRGTVAMANGGPGTNGSQFFLVYKDSDIDPNYSVFGTVTTGLDVLEKVAAAGTDDANGPGDGRPKREITISQVR